MSKPAEKYTQLLKQILRPFDLSHDFVFVFLTCCRCRPGYWIAEQDGPTGGKMLHDNGKYRRL